MEPGYVKTRSILDILACNKPRDLEGARAMKRRLKAFSHHASKAPPACMELRIIPNFAALLRVGHIRQSLAPTNRAQRGTGAVHS